MEEHSYSKKRERKRKKEVHSVLAIVISQMLESDVFLT